MLHQTKQHYKTVITHPCQLWTEYANRTDPRDGVREPTAPPTYLGSSGTWTQGGNTTSNRSRSILETTVSTLSWSRRSNFAINCFPSYLVENINMLNSFIKIIVICDKIFIKMGFFFFFAEPYNDSRRKGVRVYVSNTPIFTNGALCYTSQIQVMKITKI